MKASADELMAADMVADALDLFLNEGDDHDAHRIETFEQAGVLSSNAGLVLTIWHGRHFEEYQITVKRKR